MRAFAVTVALIASAGCAADGERPDTSSSAVFVTTPATDDDGGGASPTTPIDTATADEIESTDGAAPASAGPSVPVTSSVSTVPPSSPAAPAVGDPVVATEIVGDFDQPVDLAVRPGDDALYIVEQSGRVVRFDGEAATVLDISGRVSDGNEQGLLGLAFTDDGDVAYVDFTDRDGDTVIVEFPVAADGTLDPAGERVVLTVDQPYRNHNAGDLDIGPDGMLYVTLGDGGSGGDPERRAGDPRSLLGSLLRIDPTPSGDSGYSIPPDNPFASGEEGAPEVWSYGLRNPWKIAFDPLTGDLWIPDVGQNAFEEVNLVASVDGAPAARGVNFGWSAFEGTARFNDDVAGDGATMPVLTYRNSEDGCSISGGAPYRGTAISELEPAFVYSDFCSGTLWALDLAGQRNLVLLDDRAGLEQVSAVRAGPDGELYILERSGSVLRLIQG